jgi:hypothetical protein
MNTSKEYFLNLLNELENMCAGLDGVPYHYRLKELLYARDKLIKECLVTVGIIECKYSDESKNR